MVIRTCTTQSVKGGLRPFLETVIFGEWWEDNCARRVALTGSFIFCECNDFVGYRKNIYLVLLRQEKKYICGNLILLYIDYTVRLHTKCTYSQAIRVLLYIYDDFFSRASMRAIRV